MIPEDKLTEWERLAKEASAAWSSYPEDMPLFEAIPALCAEVRRLREAANVDPKNPAPSYAALHQEVSELRRAIRSRDEEIERLFGYGPHECESCRGDFCSPHPVSDHKCSGCGMQICQSCCDFWEHYKDGLHGSGDPQEEAPKLRSRLAAAEEELKENDGVMKALRRQRAAAECARDAHQSEAIRLERERAEAEAKLQAVEEERDEQIAYTQELETACENREARLSSTLEALEEARWIVDSESVLADTAEARAAHYSTEFARDKLLRIKNAVSAALEAAKGERTP